MEEKFIACFFTLSLDKFDDLEQTLLDYDIGKYLIGFETTKNKEAKEHFHLLFEGTEQIYNNFSKKIVERYGLRSKGKGNKKYGKVKDIRDIEKMCSYTLKGGNYRTNGFSEEAIKSYYESSFEKQSHKDISADIFAHLDEMMKQPNDNDYEILNHELTGTFFPQKTSQNYFNSIQTKIITYIINQEIQIGTPRPFVSRHAYLWIQNTPKLSKKTKISILCDLII